LHDFRRGPVNVAVITLNQTPMANQLNLDLEASIKLATEVVARKNYCKCKVTSVLRYKHKPTDDQPSAYAIEFETDYTSARIEEAVERMGDSEDGADMMREIMSNGPFKIRVLTDGKEIFDWRHFDDHIVEMNRRFC